LLAHDRTAEIQMNVFSFNQFNGPLLINDLLQFLVSRKMCDVFHVLRDLNS